MISTHFGSAYRLRLHRLPGSLPHPSKFTEEQEADWSAGHMLPAHILYLRYPNASDFPAEKFVKRMDETAVGFVDGNTILIDDNARPGNPFTLSEYRKHWHERMDALLASYYPDITPLGPQLVEGEAAMRDVVGDHLEELPVIDVDYLMTKDSRTGYNNRPIFYSDVLKELYPEEAPE